MNYNNNQIFNRLSDWFNSYADSFTHGSHCLHEAVLLKHEHTHRVCDNMEQLCSSIGLEDPLLFLARIVALFHDAGRFQQYKEFQTFQDRRSVNHSELGLKIIDENHLFDDFPDDHSSMIRTAILNHNVKTVPLGLTLEQDLLCKLIRDADKLDIYYIVASHHTTPQASRKEIIETGLPDLPTISCEICSSVTNGQIVDFSKIKCINDFKLIQVGWVYDLNFTRSFQLIKERGHFEIIKSTLPSFPEVTRAIELAQMYLDRKAGCTST